MLNGARSGAYEIINGGNFFDIAQAWAPKIFLIQLGKSGPDQILH